MPGGSRYSGPPEALELYTEAVTASRGDSVVKGAKTPYTSHAGHMFSFLDSDGRMALRLSSSKTAGMYPSASSHLLVTVVAHSFAEAEASSKSAGSPDCLKSSASARYAAQDLTAR